MLVVVVKSSSRLFADNTLSPNITSAPFLRVGLLIHEIFKGCATVYYTMGHSCLLYFGPLRSKLKFLTRGLLGLPLTALALSRDGRLGTMGVVS